LLVFAICCAILGFAVPALVIAGVAAAFEWFLPGFLSE
jgi:hypothetical protein